METLVLFDPSDPVRPVRVVIVGKHGDETSVTKTPAEARAMAALLDAAATAAEARAEHVHEVYASVKDYYTRRPVS